jgi:two-component system CheB/CheR fusion protein
LVEGALLNIREQNGAPGAACGLAVVGIGASAGGLKALEALLHVLPHDMGMAFVVIQHLSPTHPSLLEEILGRCTAMPVKQVADGTPLRPDHVFVIPPGHDLVLEGETLHLVEKVVEGGKHLSVDRFFSSLASARHALAIGIVLSGSGEDGTLGCEAIVQAGGYTLAQLPAEAQYGSMPASVIAGGHASATAPVSEMPHLLQAHRAGFESAPSGSFQAIIEALHEATGHDFTHYKQSTIERRIERRMAVQRINEQASYLQYLKDTPAEVPLLFDELLINVTGFFRDPEAFDALKNLVLKPLLEHKPDGYVFRAWVAGCASGEEAYSLGVLLLELRTELSNTFDIQLYATDLDTDAIRTARAGLYPAATARQMSTARLQAWFNREDSGYRVRSELRKLVVFAVHNVATDPPFTRLDLLCCRNLLIYLGPRLQQQVIPAFHYALKPKGVLFLSPSESIGPHGTLFSAVDRRWKLYEAIKAPRTLSTSANSARGWSPDYIPKNPDPSLKRAQPVSLEDLTSRLLLTDYVPTSVITDLRGNILYVHGDTGPYLRPAPGQATLNVIEMARQGLQNDLRAALNTAASGSSNTPVRRQANLSKGAKLRSLCVCVRRLPGTAPTMPLLLVSFEPLMVDRLPAVSGEQVPAATIEQVAELERALAHTRETLQATIDELQLSNEEYGSTNEELQSANEELQSTNEELETSREELQSVNEELITVNAELQAKVEQLFFMQNDMKNLLDSVNIGAIFLDMQLAIRRFTREATHIYRLIERDLGRSLADITSHLVNTDLIGPAQKVIDTLVAHECEVHTTHGQCFLARIMPYRTLDNVIEGVVLTFHDITSRLASEHSVQAARSLAEAVINTVREPLLVLDPNLCVVSASQSYYEIFNTSQAHTLDRPLLELGCGEWNIPALKEQLRTILTQDTSFTGLCLEQQFATVGLVQVSLAGRRVVGDGLRPDLILLTMQIDRRSLRGRNEESPPA